MYGVVSEGGYKVCECLYNVSCFRMVRTVSEKVFITIFSTIFCYTEMGPNLKQIADAFTPKFMKQAMQRRYVSS